MNDNTRLNHSNVHTLMNSNKHACRYIMYTFNHTRTYELTKTHVNTLTCTHTCIQTTTHVNTHTHTVRQTDTQTHTHTFFHRSL